jgi:hypothetical protein
MFVLLQVYPPEAADRDDECCCLDVIAVAPSEAELERFLVDYEPRYQAACREFDSWDADLFEDWTEEHDRMFDHVAAKHGVYGALVQARFEIMEVRVKDPLIPARAA